MFRYFYPRLSQSKDLLPAIRARLVAAAAHHSLPIDLSLDLLPIVEDGLFGYELLPSRETHTYLTIGSDDGGAPVLCRSLYCAAAPSALRLATVNGRILSASELQAWHGIQRRVTHFRDWGAAAEAAWAEVMALFPATPRRSIEVHDDLQQKLDDGLAMAHSHLRPWDPFIDFCGVPGEAQYGFALTGCDGQHGQLAARQPGRWTLRWESPEGKLSEEWAAVSPAFDAAGAWACAAIPAGEDGIPAALLAPAGPSTSSRQPR